MNSSKIILTTGCDWRPWLFVVKTMAIGGNVWQYINPDQITVQPEPTRPFLSNTSDASSNASHTTLASLSSDEREIFKLIYSQYKEDLAVAKQKIDTLKSIRTHLVTSVSKKNIVCIVSKDSIHEMLFALKKRLAPTDEARKLEIINKYSRLRFFDKNMGVEAWLKDWEITYADAVALDLPEVSGDRSQSNFAVALSSLDEAYSIAQ